ncbi:hypothetical protein COU49_01135 [Candidatus Nomurabacteria bacterium CG10_big_fil_rev_8_21_14_0_10_35_16]|uniref:DUF5667 domain-containing protein n=1 Tax=Candidatus Nomurabacteria bacterium CG10_big_fil_rev_8_21_14_0_10_35_16 TaxID=1974731 RepID=A0A2H0TBT0_9BACT|nr:MAG: hypothetical protein COU49_01135 [Candidatus Nomurabacteria bacterium CG10_big_fil_rev_8_21_14_0_10_35_16]
MIKKLLLIPVLAVLLLAGSAHAQTEELPDPGTLPGNPFYYFKLAAEQVGTLFTFGDLSKAERFQALAEKRLAEAQALSEEGDEERATNAAERYGAMLARIEERTQKAKEDGKDVEGLLERMAERSLKHQAVLARVFDKAPEAARPALERVMGMSAQKHEAAVQAISGERAETIRARLQEEREERRPEFSRLKERGVPVREIKDKEDDMIEDDTDEMMDDES